MCISHLSCIVPLVDRSVFSPNIWVLVVLFNLIFWYMNVPELSRSSPLFPEIAFTSQGACESNS